MQPVRPLSRRSAILQGGGLAVGLTLLPRGGWAQEGVLNIFNWDTYVAPDTIPGFEAASGLRVRYDLFASNDELFAKLRAGNPGYDVIFPSNNYAARLAEAGLLEPLDHGRIPNIANLEPEFMEVEFDPGRRFSLPYFWGTVGIGYRGSRVDRPTSWAALFTEETHAGRIALLTETDTLYAALRYLGFSINTTDPAEIDQAADLLIAAKPRIRTFAPDTGQDLLISGEVDLCLEFNGDILQVMDEDDDLGYVVPEEGTGRWEDTMCVPVGAPNPEAAHAFIDYIYTAEVHAAIAEYVRYALPNRAAKALIPEADLLNEAIYPSAEVMARSEVARYMGTEIESLYQAAMTRVLAA
jgi:spermidine/putrescine transport system substrate-binding protein